MNDLKVIGAGFPRTGTTSLKKALEILGLGHCYHMKDLIQNPNQLSFWIELEERESTDFNRLFKGYQSCVDFPGYPYYKILMQENPESKVILTTRDFDSWYISALNTIYKAGPKSFYEKLSLIVRIPFNSELSNKSKVIKFFKHIFWEKQFGNNFLDIDVARKIFLNHLNEVKEFVPAERLLVYNIKEGWAPLCSFLNLPIPSQEFPHLNKKENFSKMLASLVNGDKAN